jgi:peptide/nickel transport system permease protein
MTSYIIRRILLMIPTLIGVTIVVFGVMSLTPGEAGGEDLTAVEGLDPEQVAAIREYRRTRFGLDQPPHIRYLRWINQVSPVGFSVNEDGELADFGFKSINLGYSIKRQRPVTDLLAEALPITLLLNLITIPLIYAIGVSSGILAASKRGRGADVTVSVVTLALWSIPVIWAGVMFIGFFANDAYLNWFPATGLHDIRADEMRFLPAWTDEGFQRGWLLDMAWHLVLPVICLSYGGLAFLSKLTRGSVLENLSADFVRTARAKGVAENTILYAHVMRNSLLPLITVLVTILPAMLGGSVIVETIFSINGMGKLMIDAIYSKDWFLVMAVALVSGILGLIAYLLADILYAIADPRVTYD